MPRVETVIPPKYQPLLENLVLLRPSEILLDEQTAKARPGPPPANEEKAIAKLAQSFRETGQIVPLIVSEVGGKHYLIDGRRRRLAALQLDTADEPFLLACAVRRTGSAENSLRLAIHANLKRRGLTPLQFAYLCKELRSLYSWEGTRELSDYLQVSRAHISQHDKLLVRPAGMDKRTYEATLAKIKDGLMGADAAFYQLTNVEPTKAGEVLDAAQRKADREEAEKEAKREARQAEKRGDPPPATAKPSATQSASQNRGQSASQNRSATPKPAPRPLKPAPVQTKHLRAAAEEAGAVQKSTSKTLADYDRLFATLAGPSYPDTMRSFATVLSVQWKRGDCQDKDVVLHWNQIAILVQEAEQKPQKRPATRAAAPIQKRKRK